MTALQAISALLSLHDDDPPSSDDFQFESEYVKSLLKQQRTPSPITHSNTHKPHQEQQNNMFPGKENNLGGERWRTPVTIGAASGRTALAQRDMNIKSGGVTEDTPVVKPT